MGNAQRSLGQSSQIRLEDGREIRHVGLIGRGSGTATHRALVLSGHGVARPVAVKIFDTASSEESEDVFQVVAATVRALACVDHPNVVRVYECGTWRGKPFVVEELVDGTSLAELVNRVGRRRRRLPADVALYIASEVAAGLSGARLARDHENLQVGLLHLGLCPREILLSWRGDVKVSDFGMALARPASSSIRNLKSVVERATGLAPEVAQGAVGDARADVFSLGILLRELFVGPRFPSSLSNTEAIRLAREGYVHSYTFKPNLPPALEAMIDRALAIEPEDRFPNVCAMAAELRRIAFQMGTGDGRHFLRHAIEREWPERADNEATGEHVFQSELAADADVDEPMTQRVDDLQLPRLAAEELNLTLLPFDDGDEVTIANVAHNDIGDPRRGGPTGPHQVPRLPQRRR